MTGVTGPAFGRALQFTLIVGAAREAAHARGLDAELVAAVKPTLDGLRVTGDRRPVLDAIRSVLGEDWLPDPKWIIYTPDQLRDDGAVQEG